jgi:SPP1 gp7 family putative phage head morphogenesis protein
MSELDLQDAILRTALELQRLSAHEENEAEAILRELERELKQLLATSLDERTKAAIADLIEQAETAIDARYAAASEVVDTHGLVLLVSERTVETLHLIAPSVVKPTVETLASLSKNVLIDGAPSAAWWSKQAEDTAFKFAAAVRQGVINGETNERIVSRIVGHGVESGIMQVARRNARALVHSSVMSAANEARLATFRKNDRLIGGVRWLAALDGHVCRRCAALDGQSWDLDGQKLKDTKVEFRAPPIHWNDRCVLSPIAKSFRDIGLDIDEPEDAGTRASSEGPVHGATTFLSFFERLSTAQQDAMFGKSRAQLMRDGKITVRDLVNGRGRELSLDELLAKV